MPSPSRARAALAWRAQQKLAALTVRNFPPEHGAQQVLLLLLMRWERDGGGDDIEVAGVALRPLFRLWALLPWALLLRPVVLPWLWKKE